VEIGQLLLFFFIIVWKSNCRARVFYRNLCL
jgi:hypothetical protein